MHKTPRMGRVVRAGIALVAVVAALNATTLRVHADAGYSDEIDVFITAPVNDGDTFNLTVFTPGAVIPPAIPIGVRSVVVPGPKFETLQTINTVDTVLGGQTVGDPDISITGALDSVTATLVNVSGAEREYLAVVDATKMDFVDAPVNGEPGMSASDLVRTLVTADSYYGGGPVSDFGLIGVSLTLRDADVADTDGNGIPDATSLLQPFMLLMDPDGNITFVIEIGDVARGDSFNGEYTLAFESSLGPVEVSVDAPTLQEIVLADPGTYAWYSKARLIVTVSEEPVRLIDGPDGVDPLDWLPIGQAGSTFPPPQGFFVRTAIALTNISGPPPCWPCRTGIDERGTPPAWTFVETLPGSLEIQVRASGPGMAAMLHDGVDVYGYQYLITYSQTDEEILATGNQTGGWSLAPYDVEVENLENGDDGVGSRSIRGAVDPGDDAVTVRSNRASAVFGSNAMPSLRASDGGSGSSNCFIATAAYGTPMAGQIDSLRAVRDGYLVNSAIGAAFVDAYYRLSPPVARVVAENERMKQGVRAVLAPVVAVSRWFAAAPGSATAIACILLIAGVVAVRRVARSL